MISIIMPVFNAEKYLRESIQSILNQTETLFELVIINDGSTDNSEQIILSFEDERIVYSYQENQGEASARNKGIEISKGSYIVWQDADDVSLPNRLEVLKNTLEKYQVDFVHSDMLLIDEQGVPIGYWQSKQISNRGILNFFLKVGTPYNNGSIMIRKEIIEQQKFDADLKIGTDTDLISRIASGKNMKSLHVSQPLLLYRRHNSASSLNGKNYNDLYFHVTKILQRSTLKELFPNLNWENDTVSNNEAKAYVILAFLLSKRGMFIHANDYLVKAQSYEVSSESERFIMGLASLILNKPDQAISFFQSIKVKDAITENYLGECFGFKGDFVKAKTHFLNSIYLAPDYIEPIENLRSIGASIGLNLIDHTWKKYI